MTDEGLAKAVQAVGAEVALDVSLFLPDDETHFDPISAALGLGATLVIAFIDGVMEGMKGEVRSLGRRVGARIAHRLASFVPDAPAPSTAEMTTAAQEAADGLSALPPNERIEVNQLVEGELAGYLHARGMTAKRANAVAAKVRDEIAATITSTGEASP
jgi:hypothetical protein